jgi:hypothetical protein
VAGNGLDGRERIAPSSLSRVVVVSLESHHARPPSSCCHSCLSQSQLLANNAIDTIARPFARDARHGSRFDGMRERECRTHKNSGFNFACM